MKKIFQLSALVVAVIFASCTKEAVVVGNVESPNSKKQETLALFDQHIDQARLHSAGLHYVFQKLETSQYFRSLTPQKHSAEKYADLIQGLSLDYSKTLGKNYEELVLRTSQPIMSMVTATHLQENPKASFLRTLKVDSYQPLPKECVAFLDSIMESISEESSALEVRDVVESCLTSDKVLLYPQETRVLLSIVGAVFVDSFGYWQKNLDSWINQIQGRTTQARWFPSWKDLREGLARVTRDDAESAGQAAIIAAGLAATGVGAGGALGGICASAVVGSAWGATTRAFRSGLVSTESLEKEIRLPDSVLLRLGVDPLELMNHE